MLRLLYVEPFLYYILESVKLFGEITREISGRSFSAGFPKISSYSTKPSNICFIGRACLGKS